VNCWLLKGGFRNPTPALSALKATAFALIFMAAVYVTFKLVLDVPTPKGIFL
jgi:hypothetical protein